MHEEWLRSVRWFVNGALNRNCQSPVRNHTSVLFHIICFSTYLSSKILTTSSQPCIAEWWTERVLLIIWQWMHKVSHSFRDHQTHLDIRPLQTTTHVEMRKSGHVLCMPLSRHVTDLYAGTEDPRTLYLQCAAESCTFCSPSSRHPALWEAGAVWPEDRPPCRRCERSSSRLCFSVPGLRRGTAAPGSRQGFSECRPSSEESWAGRASELFQSHIKSYHTVRFFKYSEYMR